MWPIVNQIVSLLFDVLLWPVSGLGAGWQALLLGIPAALLALLVFRYASNQAGIEREKDRIKAHLLELRLYKDDFKVSLLAQWGILRHNMAYLGHALLPMAVMIVPFVLILIQVESRFAFRSLEPGEAALLTVTLDSDEPVSQLPVELRLPADLVRETPALRIDQSDEVVWRVRGEQAGVHEIVIAVGDDEIRKRVVVGANGTWVATDLYRASDWGTLLYPQEPALADDGPARALQLSYPRALGEFAGLSTASWILFGSSILFGFALRGVVGVTF